MNSLKGLGEVVEQKTDEENNYQGDYHVIKLDEKKFGKDVYIKVEDSTDSYGNEYTVDSIQIVQPTKTIITDFKSI